ncbi:MAG: metal-dependent hydrolase [Candidatus Methylomirabilia bacterium]
MMRPAHKLSIARWLSGLTAVLASAAIVVLAGASAAEMSGNTKVTWYGHAAFKIETPSGGVILIDPWIKNPKNPDKAAISKLTKVDYILLTHAHFDHVGQTVQIAKATGAKMVSSFGLGRNLVAIHGFPKAQAGFDTMGNVGGLIRLPRAGAQVTIVNAVHGSEVGLPKPEPGGPTVVIGGNPVGFVLEVDNGPTFYHTGDTDVFTDMKLVGDLFTVDVMLSAIGDHFTMGPRRAAVAVEFVKPKIVVPIHFGTFPVLTGTPAAFQAEIKKRGLSTEMVEMKPGETRAF